MRPGIIKDLFIFLFLFSFFLAAGQSDENIDSRTTRKIVGGIREIDSLDNISRSLVFIDPAKSLEYANWALRLAIDNQYERGTAESYRILSGIYAYSENYSLSMEFNQQAFDIFSQLNDSAGIANCYISLGHINKGLGQNEIELDYHRKSYAIFTRLQIHERMGVTSYNLGESYYNNGDTSNSRKMILRSVQINDSLQNLAVLSACYNILGKLELANKKPESAKEYFFKVLKIKDILGAEAQEIATSESIMQLASISRMQNRRREQFNYLKMAEQFCLDNNLHTSLKVVYLELVKYYTDNNDASAAGKYLQVYKSVQDSINRMQLSHMYNLTRNISVVHQLSQQKRNLEQEKIKHLQEIRERNIILVSTIFSILTLSVLLVSIIRSNRKLRIQKATIETQSKQLEILNNTKDKFFGIISHDLRSPLNSIKSVSMLLSEYIETMDKAKIEKLARELGSTVENTIRMTENLSSWARIQMKDFKTFHEKFGITEIISPVYRVYGEVAKQKEIQLECEFDHTLTVLGDKNQIEFILRNLVNNAIKFTNRGGKVGIRAIALNEKELQLIVSDNGIGIPENRKNELFELGKHRVSYGTEQEKGTGLGLLLVNDFLKLNNGKIDIDSEAGKGTTIRVTLLRY